MLRLISTIIVFGFYLSLSAQTVHLFASGKPLNQVLIEMRDKYDLKFSFDDKLLSQYQVEINQTFTSPTKALESLLGKFPLSYQKQDGVFVIYPAPMYASKEAIQTAKNTEYKISGLVSDKLSGETLPYASIQVNGFGVSCDETGRFSFISRGDSVFDLRISHLGYFVQDTVILPDVDCNFKLVPATYKIREVEVLQKVGKNLTSTELPGAIRANNLIANNLPGSGNASVFNFLRLMPGFLAAGEQTQDLVIWGCYEGQSQLSVDGYTLFGLKNFNDNISSVNPYMVKDIKLLKGGYGAQYGGRIGGIVDISGIDGNVYKPEFKINLNNLTVNALASTTVGNRASLTAAFRQTFYNLYDVEKLNPFRNNSRSPEIIQNRGADFSGEQPQSGSDNIQNLPFNGIRSASFVMSKADQPGSQNPPPQFPNSPASIYLYPDYDFRDANLKFSGKTSGGDSYSISTYGGRDQFNYSLQDSLNNDDFTLNAKQKSTQWGASSIYNKLWQNGNRTRFNLAYSSLESNSNSINSFAASSSVSSDLVNRILEVKALIDNNFSFSSYHTLLWGGGITSNAYRYEETGSSLNRAELKNDVQLLHLYSTDQINLSRSLYFNPGLRLDYSFLEHKAYWQPRISAYWLSTDLFKIAASWGKYNQFISKNIVIDSRGNNHQTWMVCDGEKIPVPSASHWVLGAYFNKGGFSTSAEGYYKSIDGLYRVDRSRKLNETQSYFGEGRSAGVDFLIKQQYRRHYAWVSYSYSKTEELFPEISTSYLPASQDQRHEIKSALILDFKHWVFSSNYVYGSGFPVYTQGMTLSSDSRKKYNRLDTSLSYRFSPKRFSLQTGISILNVFDSSNLKMSELVQDPSAVNNVLTIYSHSIPFTPMIFLELSF